MRSEVLTQVLDYEPENRSKYLIILPCSKKKRVQMDVSALDLYDGPFYQILRNNIKDYLDLLIVSSKYGLISSNKKISFYDQKMTKERAKELSKEVSLELVRILDKNYREIFISLGKSYIPVLDDSRNVLNKHKVVWANGQIGERMHQMKIWLNSISVSVHRDDFNGF